MSDVGRTCFRLNVSDPPSTAVTHTSTWKPTEGEGSSITLTCDITDGRPQNDIKSVTWKKGDNTLTTSGRYQLSDNKLTISSLDHTVDNGHYSCAAENEAGRGDFSATFHLQINCKYFQYVCCLRCYCKCQQLFKVNSNI